MQPVNEVYENISYDKFNTTPSMKRWMRSGGGIVNMIAIAILTLPACYIVLPLVLMMRSGFYKSLTYKLDVKGQMLVIERKGKVQASVDLRRVTDIKYASNGNIFFYSKDRFAKKTKLFSVDSEPFKRELQATWRSAQPATQADFQRREYAEQAVYGGP